MVLSTREPDAPRALAEALYKRTDLLEFRLAPSGD
jgi:hypothetical protein